MQYNITKKHSLDFKCICLLKRVDDIILYNYFFLHYFKYYTLTQQKRVFFGKINLSVYHQVRSRQYNNILNFHFSLQQIQGTFLLSKTTKMILLVIFATT